MDANGNNDQWDSENNNDYSRPYDLVPNLNTVDREADEDVKRFFSRCFVVSSLVVMALCCFALSQPWSPDPLKPDEPSNPERDLNIKGFNFDPTSDTVFNQAVRMCDFQDSFGNYPKAEAGLALMHSVFENKLSVVATLLRYSLGNQSMLAEISAIKTFYTLFSSIKGKCQVNVIEEINDFNQKYNSSLASAAGIYLFVNGRDGCDSTAQCNQWVEAQLTAFQDAVKKYPKVVRAVVIGNEDENQLPRVYDIAKQLQTFKRNNQLNFSVMTAQTTATVEKMLTDGDSSKDLVNLDAVGANIYPYWAGVPFSEAFSNFEAQYWHFKKLARTNNIALVVTETGWPSAGPRGSMQTMYDYFNWLIGFNVMGRNIRAFGLNSFFIFQVFDKLAAGVEGNWGICSHDSGDKVANSIYSSCIIDPKGHQQTKSLSTGNKLLGIKTNFKKPLALLVCDNSTVNDNCGFVNGNRAASQLKKGSDLMVYQNAIAMFKLLFIWDLDAANPPGWCYAASQAISDDPNKNHICWEPDHSYAQCDLKAAC